MKTSDWTKYHGTHQGRCTQCDCLFHHSFLFKQSFNSNRLPKTQTHLRGTWIHVNALYCTFSITFYKSVYVEM